MPFRRLLLTGAAGGLGSAAVQVAKHLGGRVIAAAGSDERVATATGLGADAGVNYRACEVGAEVLRITEGGGVSLVLDNMGDPDLFPQALASLAPGGRLVTAGAHAGGKVVVDLHRLYQRQLAIIGAVAPTMPMPNNCKATNSELASAAAARYFGPSQPSISVSVVKSEICATCATISGQPSLNRAPNSAPQPDADNDDAAPETGAADGVLISDSTRAAGLADGGGLA